MCVGVVGGEGGSKCKINGTYSFPQRLIAEFKKTCLQFYQILNYKICLQYYTDLYLI